MEGETRKIWRVRPQALAAVTRGQTKGKISVWDFSSDSLKDAVSAYMVGEAGDWMLPGNCPVEYVNQLLAERKEQVLNKDKLPTGKYVWHQLRRDNHWLDCECMMLVGCMAFSEWAHANGHPEQAILGPTVEPALVDTLPLP